MLVRLADLEVGTLRKERGEQWVFRMLESYRRAHHRPILGQVFEDDLEREWRRRVRLPPFFSNLLPEGALRHLLAEAVGVPAEREGFLLAHLGQDLPGAVVVEWEEGEELVEGPTKLDREEAARGRNGNDRQLKFSLAGVQLKLSALGDERGFTIPASGQGGDWIVKLPLKGHEDLPEVEWSMLEWAERAGFQVPKHRLIAVEDVRNLPTDWPIREGRALAVRRFDRPEPGRRVHQEDFAQVLDVYPDYKGKYRSASHETLARVLRSVTGEAGFREYVKRLVFMVFSGNGDAHLKNWSLIYRDGQTAELSPLYDQVFTRAFLNEDDLALRIGGERDFYRIDLDTFRRFSQRTGADPAETVRLVGEVADRIQDAWSEARADMPIGGPIRQQIETHMKRLRL